jgi:hypothetical protein
MLAMPSSTSIRRHLAPQKRREKYEYGFNMASFPRPSTMKGKSGWILEKWHAALF